MSEALYRLKPLEWTLETTNGWAAETPYATLWLSYESGGYDLPWVTNVENRSKDIFHMERHASREEAVRRIEAFHLEQMLSGLEPVPQ
jgi:hypothetical protein